MAGDSTARCSQPNLHVSSADRILELVHLRRAGLIVLGVKPEEGDPGAATHLPNATAHNIVSHAECPVLTVRS
jgi:nucleotide-binding universal stress UspA family protein